MDVDNKYEFNCPQYFDFNTSIQNDDMESYFDVDHENEFHGPLFTSRSLEEKTFSSFENKHYTKGLNCSQTQSTDSCAKALYKQKTSSTRKYASKQDGQKSSKLHVSDNLNRFSEEKENISVQKSKRQKISEKLQKHIYNLRSSTPSSHKTPIKERNSSTKKCFPFKVITPNSSKSAVNRSASLQDSKKPASKQSSPIRRRSITVPKTVDPSTKVKKLTLPSTPNCIRRVLANRTGSNKVKSTEELELAKIAQFRKQLASNRKIKEQTLKKTLAVPPSTHSISISSQHTVVKPFNFATEQRIKSQGPKQIERAKDFISSLRQHTPKSSEKIPTKVTKPVPFNLTQNRKRKRTGEGQETYHSLAQKIMAFEKKTPVRFHSVGKENFDESTQQKFQSKVTQPHTPKLQTLARHRPVTVLSHEQQEELDLEEMKRYKFKAKPFNPKLFNETMAGIPKLEGRPPTKPVDFPLETEKRYWLRDRNTVEETKYEFHAHPVPEKILKGTVGLKEKIARPVTQPKSPEFAVKEREEAWKQRTIKEEIKVETHLPTIKSRPAPHSGCSFSVKWKKKNTVIQPFSFDSKDQERWMRKEERIKDELDKDKKMHDFYAHPMPNPSPRGIPEKQKKPPTKPQPFNLSIDQRGEERAGKWQKEVEEELEKQKEASVFKAQPATVLYMPPFRPEKSLKPLTEIEEISLNTEHRASERERFEEYKRKQDAKLKAEREKQREIEEEKEREALIHLRAETTHKANPIRHFKAVEVKPSDKELTNPRSPEFATKQRIRKQK